MAHSPKIAIRDWSGEVRLGAESLEGASLLVRAKTASLEVLDELRDDERRILHRVMREEVLEVAQFPELIFQSSTVSMEPQKKDLYRANLAGKLTLHGVTNSHSFFAQLVMGTDSFRAYGEFRIRQTDYGIKVALIAGGTLKLQEELKCVFYVVARKKE